jgi:hypothetical protein
LNPNRLSHRLKEPQPPNVQDLLSSLRQPRDKEETRLGLRLRLHSFCGQERIERHDQLNHRSREPEPPDI